MKCRDCGFYPLDEDLTQFLWHLYIIHNRTTFDMNEIIEN